MSGKPRLVMRVPPHLLLFKTRLAGLANQRIAQAAETFAHSTGRGVARYVAYEAMQLDMAGVLRDLFAALGAPPLERWQAARREAVQVKAGSENVSAAVSNFGELEAALLPVRHKRRVIPYVFRGLPLEDDLYTCLAIP